MGYLVWLCEMGDESFEGLRGDVGLVVVFDVLEEFIEGIVVRDAVEDFGIVVESDPLYEALKDILLVDGVHLPGRSGNFIEFDEDTVLLGN